MTWNSEPRGKRLGSSKSWLAVNVREPPMDLLNRHGEACAHEDMAADVQARVARRPGGIVLVAVIELSAVSARAAVLHA